jgi:hypothetical protein
MTVVSAKTVAKTIPGNPNTELRNVVGRHELADGGPRPGVDLKRSHLYDRR